jgi:putative ABC transport system permease protein
MKLLKLAFLNLTRYSRRSFLTVGLIVLGVMAVLMFVSVSGSFKSMMVGQITDSMLGHAQIHHKGYVASIDNLPLSLNIPPKGLEKIEALLQQSDFVEAYSPRLKFGAMLSNFEETTSIRLNAVYPEREVASMPALMDRVVNGDGQAFVQPGQILLPQLLARGLKLNVGDTIVLVATNREGSVNGQTFRVQGILQPVTGPGGRDGYLHIDDAQSLLRLSQPEVNEIAVRLKSLNKLPNAMQAWWSDLGELKNQQGAPMLELHRWDDLSPFANIAKMIDLLDVFIRVMLVGIVLIAIMNVMMMAVYERTREIGTMAALGTQPSRILGLFLTEGFLLGVLGSLIGVALSLLLVFGLSFWPIEFAFGRQQLILIPTLQLSELLWVSFIVTMIAVLASLQPAWKASRLDPIQALRQV